MIPVRDLPDRRLACIEPVSRYPDLRPLMGTKVKTAVVREHWAEIVRHGGAGTSAPAAWLLPLSRLHARWEADLTHFRAALQGAGISPKSQDMVLPALEHMAQQIGRLKARL